MIFDPLFNWMVPTFGLLFDKINTATTKPLPTLPKPSHPEPHRDAETGKIVIENCKLYNEDLLKYGSVQTMKWVNEGKYNLTPEELEKEHLRIEKEYLEKFERLNCLSKKDKIRLAEIRKNENVCKK